MSGRVVVAGGGMSGLVAACAALQAGADVTVLEKGPRAGGSMLMSNGFLVTFDDVAGIRAAVPEGDSRLQEQVVSSFADDAHWLGTLGVRLRRRRRRVGGRSGYRLDPAQAVSALAERVRTGGRLLLATGLARLAVDSGRLVGVEVRAASGTVRLPADAVVLATGGFQGNPELLARLCQLRPEALLHRANPWSTGDGLLAALEAGAQASGSLSGFYGHAMTAEPAHLDDRTFAAATQYQGNECVALNLAGRRFTDESAGTGEEVLNQALARQPAGVGFYVGDDAIARLQAPRGSGVLVADILRRAEALGGPVLRAATLEELSDALQGGGANGVAALASLQEYREGIRAGQPAPGGVARLRNRHPLERPPFWAVKVRSGITFTTGGLAVDPAMSVLDRAGSSSTLAAPPTTVDSRRERALPGVFAAGADVGGVSATGYAGGLAAALVTGRMSGRSAARFAK